MRASTFLVLLTAGLAGCGPTSGTADAPSPDAPAAPIACEGYCAILQTACTGANAQYASTAECMTACPSIPVGDFGVVTGDTLGCRVYHAAMVTADTADVHCPHAGPTGGGVCM